MKSGHFSSFINLVARQLMILDNSSKYVTIKPIFFLLAHILDILASRKSVEYIQQVHFFMYLFAVIILTILLRVNDPATVVLKFKCEFIVG